MTGWFIAYRCGCTDFEGARDAIKDVCPKHGKGSNHGPALVSSADMEPGFQEAA